MLLVQLRWRHRDGVFRQIIVFPEPDSIYICLVRLKIIEGNKKGLAQLSFHSSTPPPLLLWWRIAPDGCVVTAFASSVAPPDTLGGHQDPSIKTQLEHGAYSIHPIAYLHEDTLHCALSSWRSFSVTRGVLGDFASYHRQPQVLPLMYGMGIRLDVEPSLYPLLVPWFLLHPTLKECTDRPTDRSSHYLIYRHPRSSTIVAQYTQGTVRM
jgi:hypothetical protein